MGSDMDIEPVRFIGEPVQVEFDQTPTMRKRPGCPDGFFWRGTTYRVAEQLSEWHDYARRGRMATNMRPEHAAAATRRGSWGVGRDYYRVRAETGEVFELYYDRTPAKAGDRQGGWFLDRQVALSEPE